MKTYKGTVLVCFMDKTSEEREIVIAFEPGSEDHVDYVLARAAGHVSRTKVGGADSKDRNIIRTLWSTKTLRKAETDEEPDFIHTTDNWELRPDVYRRYKRWQSLPSAKEALDAVLNDPDSGCLSDETYQLVKDAREALRGFTLPTGEVRGS